MNQDLVTVVFRKFLNPISNSFVSVISESYSGGSADKAWVNNSVSLAISTDNKQSAEFYYSFDTGDDNEDKKYEEAIEELEALRSALSATIEEVATLYLKSKASTLDE